MRRERDNILRNRKSDREMPTHMHTVREGSVTCRPQHHTHSETHIPHFTSAKQHTDVPFLVTVWAVLYK